VLKQEKERVVAELTERLRASDTLILADYRGLSMTQIDQVRTELLKHGARFTVVKNTLTRRAADAAGVDALNEFLDGPTAIAFVGDGDMVAVARTLNTTARETRVLTLKGGLLQGQVVTADQVKNLATLPPTDVLQGQVLGAVVGPLNAIVGLFAAPLRDFVGVIDARIKQLEEQGEVPSEQQTTSEGAKGQTADEGSDPVGAGIVPPAEEESASAEETTSEGSETEEEER
jgi:large subunit ribosomal protein L10